MAGPTGYAYFTNLQVAGGNVAVNGSLSAPNTNPGAVAGDYVVPLALTGPLAAMVINGSERGSANNYDDVTVWYNNAGVLTQLDYLYDSITNGPWSATNLTLWFKLQANLAATSDYTSTTYARDGFSRTVAANNVGWGTADVGGTYANYGGTASVNNFSVAPSTASLLVDNSAEAAYLPSVSVQDVEVSALITPATSPNTCDQGIMCRIQGANGACYQLNAYEGGNTGTYTIQLKRRTSISAFTQLGIDIPTSLAGGTAVWMRLRAVGMNPTILSYKVWSNGSPEPAAWLGSMVVDTTGSLGAGAVGLIGYVNTAPPATITTTFNSFLATSIPAPAATSPDGTTTPGGYVLAWGNGAPTSKRNPANVYPLYDNFPGTTLNAMWTPLNSPVTTVSNGLTFSASATAAEQSISSSSLFGPGYRVELVGTLPVVTAGYYVLEFRPAAGGSPYDHLYTISGTGAWQLSANPGTGDNLEDIGAVDNATHTFAIDHLPDGTTKGWIDLLSRIQLAGGFTSTNLPVRLMVNQGTSGTMIAQQVRVRPIIATEPMSFITAPPVLTRGVSRRTLFYAFTKPAASSPAFLVRGLPISRHLAALYPLREGWGGLVHDAVAGKTSTGSTLVGWNSSPTGIAASLGAVNSQIVLPNLGLVGSGPMACEVICTPSSLASQAEFVSWGSGSQGNGFFIRATDSVTLDFFFWYGDLNVTVPNMLGRRLHIIASWDGTYQSLYLNGLLVGHQTPGISVNVHDTSYAIGQSATGASGTGNAVQGVYEKVAFYQRAIAPEEASSLYLRPFQMYSQSQFVLPAVATPQDVKRSFAPYGRTRPPMGAPVRVGSDLGRGCIASWDMQERGGSIAYDTTPARRRLTPYAGAPAWSAGGLVLGGSTEMDTPNLYPYIGGVGHPLTIEAWVTPVSPGASNWQNIASQGRDAGGSNWFGLWISSSNNWTFGYGLSLNVQPLAASGGKHHLIASYSSGVSLDFTIDGVTYHFTPSAQSSDSTVPFEVGNWHGGSEWFAGTIHSLRVWDRYLTPAEHRHLYERQFDLV
jgi:hypothetical protein